MDLQTGQVGNQTAGNPIFPGTLFTGPLLSGNVFNSDGTGNLAGAGETTGTANVGYITAAQSVQVSQAANTTTPTNIVIPAQSQILRITAMVYQAWSGANTTFNIGSSGNTTFFTATGAANGSTRGPISFSPGTTASTIANWDNIGNTDVQVACYSVNTGNGNATLTVEYVPAINNAA